MGINLRQGLEILHSGNWCSLRFITANVKKRTGGKVVELAKCRIARNKPVDVPANAVEPAPATGDTRKVKDPNHNLHFTRNVELQNKQLIKVHPITITHINNTSLV